ncbi:MAG: hypothetical protein IPQ16_15345 [Geobacteraceae bacterium]|nr:hypothetical protein [Geobacteraceae bacterium]
MQKEQESSRNLNISERRDVAIILAGVLFVINFLCIYFIWSFIFPEITGILRLVLCWIGAYSMTWFMTYVTKGVSRLILTLIMLAVQYVIFHYRP